MENNGNICKFPPTSPAANEIVPINFVHEKNWRADTILILSSYRMHFVTAGEGTLVLREKRYPLTKGDIFFSFPAKEYQILNAGGLETVYISFAGGRAASLCERLRLSPGLPVRWGYGDLEDFLLASLERMNPANGDLVTEAALYYVLSRVESFPVEKTENGGAGEADVAVRVKKYADEHFTEKELTLERIAEKLGYSVHYLSARFAAVVGISFREYLTGLRMYYAERLIEEGVSVVYEVAAACGYADPLYFSKVFRKRFGCTAKEMIGQRKQENNPKHPINGKGEKAK